jgi:TrpR-related protein YerC/YecD
MLAQERPVADAAPQAGDRTDRETADAAARALCEALLGLKDAEEARRFLIDLCTPAEIRALSERWHVARLLNDGNLSYRQINEATGVSTATIVRVARFLRDEPHQGYRAILDRLKG